jgi:murein DD-endopeptidase MepM/ murein hydrolase activator NlpD
MKKIFLLSLIILPICLFATFYFLDKVSFLCPIDYKSGIAIRCDSMGDGFFSASRNGNRRHAGIDLLAQTGTPVRASRLGIVTAASQNRGMGKYVAIKHFQGLTTIYGHLSQISVRKNSFVRQGDIIGMVGKTGNANSKAILPHLHFEVRKDGIPVDPLSYLQ